MLMRRLRAAFSPSRFASALHDFLVPIHPYRFAIVLAGLFYTIQLVWMMGIAIQNNGLVVAGKPFGTDFLSFYAASKLALSGTPELAYSIDAHWAVQKALFGEDIDYYAFFYPPIFLLYCLGFGFLPYLAAVSLWITLGFCAFWAVAKRLGGEAISLFMLLAFGGTYITIVFGQNAFLSTALIGAFVLFVPNRPVFAGVMVGLLAFKPHLGILIPFVLIAAGLWRSFFSASLTVFALVLTSLFVFGIETWCAFISNTHMAFVALEENYIGNEKMHSLFGAARLLGAPLWFAYSFQLICAVIVLCINIYSARRLNNKGDVAVIMACSIPLMTPFILNYDLTLLAIPLIWLFRKGLSTGFNTAERVMMLLAFCIPYFANGLARDLHIPLAPFVVIGLFCLIVTRANRVVRFD